MPRASRFAPGGYLYHALNRAVARLPLFEKDGDFAAFQRVMVEAQARCPIRILGVCLMPNHSHFVLWPAREGLSRDRQGAYSPAGSLTVAARATPTRRWHAHFHTAGTGHLYQGRFKAFPIQEDKHLYALLR